MSAEEFQRAFADLLRSPARCAVLRRGGPAAEPDSDPLQGCQLTARERSRLCAMSGHRGMVVNCTLYRASRLVGITRRLPMTVDLLDAALREVFDAYLEAQSDAEPEFDREALRFADFLATSGWIDRAVHKVLAAETAALRAAVLLPAPGSAGRAPGHESVSHSS